MCIQTIDLITKLAKKNPKKVKVWPLWPWKVGQGQPSFFPHCVLSKAIIMQSLKKIHAIPLEKTSEQSWTRMQLRKRYKNIYSSTFYVIIKQTYHMQKCRGMLGLSLVQWNPRKENINNLRRCYWVHNSHKSEKMLGPQSIVIHDNIWTKMRSHILKLT